MKIIITYLIVNNFVEFGFQYGRYGPQPELYCG